MQTFRLACIQPRPGTIATPEYIDSVISAAPQPIQIAVLPELSTSPYFPLEADSLDALAPITMSDPLLGRFGGVASRNSCFLMLGLHLADDDGRWNAVIVFGPDGSIVHGRTASGELANTFKKVHLCDIDDPPSMTSCESAYFKPGNEYLVWDLPFGVIGALICYDRHFPEAWATLRSMGAEVVCVPTTSAESTEPTFVAEAQAMALQQSVFVAMANRVGPEVLKTSGRKTAFLGSSCIVDPAGHPLAVAPPREAVEMVTAELSAERLAAVRARNRFYENRRPDSYALQRAGSAATAIPHQPQSAQ